MVVPPKEGTSRVRFGELFRKHRLRTLSYCSVFWSFGMCVAFLGPTLLDLECRLESLLSTMSWIFFSQALFTLIGAACGGFLVQKCGNSLLLLISTIMICFTLAIIPLCTVLFWLSCVLAFMGFFMGTIDTVANIAMIELYGRNVAPFLQALHFCYGLGAFVSPLVARPFLLNKDCSELVENAIQPKHKLHMLKRANFTDPLQEISEAQNNSQIEIAFWILASMQIPVIILLSVLVVKDVFGWGNKYDVNAPGYVETKDGIEMNKASFSEEIPVDNSEDRPAVTKQQVMLIVGATVALLFIYDGLQAGYGDYIYSYSVKNVPNMPNDEAAYLNSCFWGMFAFGRLLSIGLATKLAPAFMLSVNIIGCLCSMILMLFFQHSHPVLYIGTALFGMFLSSVYPTSVTLAETYISVTSFIASIMVAGAASGEMMMPVIFGYEFDGIGPVSLLVSSLVMILMSCFIYVLVTIVGDTIIRQTSDKSVTQRIKSLFRPSNAEELTEDSGLLSHNVKYYKRMKSEPSDQDLRTSPAVKSPIGEKTPTETAHINGAVTSTTVIVNKDFGDLPFGSAQLNNDQRLLNFILQTKIPFCFFISRGKELMWPSHSPDSKYDFFLWSYLKERFYVDRPRTLQELKNNRRAIKALEQEVTAMEPVTTMESVTVTDQVTKAMEPVTINEQETTTIESVTVPNQVTTAMEPVTIMEQEKITMESVTVTDQVTTATEPVTINEQETTTTESVTVPSQVTTAMEPVTIMDQETTTIESVTTMEQVTTSMEPTVIKPKTVLELSLEKSTMNSN